MNKNKILQEILNDKSLKEKYWKDVNVYQENINTAKIHKNKNIKTLAILLSDDSKAMKLKNIKNIFEI